MGFGTGTIMVTDSNGGTAEVAVSITITGIVEAPDVSAMSADVHENDMSGPNLLEVSSPDSGVTFSVDNDKFEIDTVGSASVLKLKDGMYLDHEGTGGMVTLMITASDGTTTSAATEVTINVGDVNEAPMISVMDSETPDGMTAAASIMENAAGIPVGEIMVSDYDMADADLSDMITVSDDRFEVSKDAEGGLWLKLKDGVSLDHETDPMVTVTVGVTDTGTNGMAMSASTDVVVSVGNVNEGPTISVVDSMTPDGMPARSNIPENQAGVPVGEIMISDPDAADAMLGEDDITLSGDHAMYFELDTDAEGGIWLKLKDGVSLNYEEMSSVMVTVTVTDSGMATAMDTVTVTVGNVNEPPSISVENAMIAENTTGKVGTVTVTDNEEMRDITLDVEDIEVVGAGSPFRVIEDGMGDYVLELTRPIDFESDMVMKDDDFTGYVEVVLEVTDEGLNGSDPITTTQTIKVMVVNEDEAPTISVMDGMTPDGMPAVSSINENSNMDGDVPVGLIMASDPENGDYGEADVDITGADADSFTVKEDDDGMLWLMLNMGASADHEGDGGSLNVTLTVSDGNNAPAMTDFTLTLMDVNEAPTASGTAMLLVDPDGSGPKGEEPMELPDTYSWDVDRPKQYKIDVTELFQDMDGDTLFDYSIGGDKPEWLELTEQRVDGKSIIVLGGVPQPKHHAGYWEVELVATDQGGESGSFMLKIVADDGNDRITGITFADADGDNPFFEADINENDMKGVVIGTFTADDPDNELHANGMTTWKVEGDPRFEIDPKTGVLMLSQGKYLNHEATSGDEVTLTVTAIDGGDPKNEMGTSMSRSFTVNIVDQNDAPKPGPVGNWWVTVDEDLNTRAEKGEDDFIGEGSWLSFSLETVTNDDDRPAFTDEDLADKDALTYSIVSGPDWLGINPKTGALFNKEGMAATETGIEKVMVRATDKAGAMADAMFEIAVVISDKNDSGMFTDNDNPDIKADEFDIPENAGAGTVVARFTVTDEDLPVGEIHPWGMLDVSIQVDADNDVLNQDPTEVLAKPNPAHSFSLHMTGKQGDTATYEVRLTDAGAKKLDAEAAGGDEVTLTIRAKDASITGDVDIVSAAGDGMDITTVRFKIDDVNEAPVYTPDTTGSSELTGGTATMPLTFAVEQQEPMNTRIYLNLTKLFEDPDGNDNDDDISFMVELSQTPWLTFASFWNEDEERMQSGPQEWDHIRYGRNEKEGGDDGKPNDDIVWGTGTDPDPSDIVLILDVDRTGSDPVPGSDDTRPNPAEIRQDADGSIMITALDDENADTETTIVVAVMDENLPARGDGVSVSDDTPGQGDRLTIRFNEDVDPDFTGTEAVSDNPVLVVYTWKNADVDGTGDDTVQVSIDNSAYVVKHTDVGDMLKAEVRYYELFNDPDNAGGFDLVMSADDVQALAALDDMSDKVRDRPDAAKVAGFTVTTTEDRLMISVVGEIMDADGVPDGTDPDLPEPVYTWEYSVNGVGGWKTFDDVESTTTEDTIIIGEDQGNSVVQNNYVRVVITYTDEGGFKERIVSESVKVGPLTDHDNDDSTAMRAIDTKTAPTIDDGSESNTAAIPAGRILRLEGLDGTKVAKGSITVEWIVGGKTVHTGETYEVSAADRGSIMVKVTTKAEGGGLVSIVESSSRALVAKPTEDSAPIVDPDASKIIDLGAAPAKDGVYKMLSGKVNMASLFEDVEGLASFEFGTPTGGGFGQDEITVGALNLYSDLRDDGSDQILVVNEQNGEVEYHGTQAQNHGGTPSDGEGNFITVQLTATDKARATASTDVMLRIDAAATGIEVDGTGATAASRKPYALETDPNIARVLTEEIEVKANSQGVQTNKQVAAMIDIQDSNQGKHKYGQYNFEVVGDWEGIFEVVRDKNDGSMATLRLATGQELDFETIKGNPDDDGYKSIVVEVKATPVDMANSGFKVETIGITVKVANDPNDGEDVPVMPPPTDTVPGLDDDEEDSDEDGGTPAPMDAMAAFAFALDGGLF